MIKRILSAIGVLVGTWAVMVVLANLIPVLQGSVFGLMVYLIPIIATVLFFVKYPKEDDNAEMEPVPQPRPAEAYWDPNRPQPATESKERGNIMYCKFCGNEIDHNSAFCAKCGAKLNDKTPVQHSNAPQQSVINIVNNNSNVNRGFGYIHKRKWVAFFLCLFLGYFGIHRFYVGKIGTGIIWLLTAGFFGIGWILDLIIILLGGFRDKAGQPLI